MRANQVVLGTNVFPSPVRRYRPYVVPVWDHVLVTEPLPAPVLAEIGWQGRMGVGDAGNQFHYYRLTDDDRLLFGGYDALYYFGNDLGARRARSDRHRGACWPSTWWRRSRRWTASGSPTPGAGRSTPAPGSAPSGA